MSLLYMAMEISNKSWKLNNSITYTLACNTNA